MFNLIGNIEEDTVENNETFNANEFNGSIVFDASYIDAINMAFDLVSDTCISTIAALSAPVESITVQQLASYDDRMKRVCATVGINYRYVDVGNLTNDSVDIGNLSSSVADKIKEVITKIIDAVKAAWKAIKKKATDFWKKHFSNLGRMKKKLKGLRSEANKLGYNVPTEIDITSVYDALAINGEITSDPLTFFHTLSNVVSLTHTTNTAEYNLKAMMATARGEDKSVVDGIYRKGGTLHQAVSKDFGYREYATTNLTLKILPTFPGGWNIDIVPDLVNHTFTVEVKEVPNPPLEKGQEMREALTNDAIASLADSISWSVANLNKYGEGLEKLNKIFDKAMDYMTPETLGGLSPEEVSAMSSGLRSQVSAITKLSGEYTSRSGNILMAYYKLMVLSLQANKKAKS